ncbi:uncharacterized protein LOC119004695 [Acanthopagrus latus]|uniref:uncharacterized protein LOC119004695 n=1 Tax=Acanthopagrus latus TaxID=8177 RepID=UPI00187C90E1|nr:uncharacterized protein LOC119004695 [Acanthopagrus latus]XP_036927739.1 uncharacterized protein LOC119004695 [Acanthopagrus latus]XP_036927740.1 uncharacterized protein LOC119004695 [Acanthopagrus latus]
MDKLRRKFLLIFFTGFIVVLFLTVKTPTTYRSIPKPRGPSAECPPWISEDSITPLNGTKHLLVSAYMDQRVKGFDIRIIGMFKRDSIQPLHCLFCCAGWLSTTTPATISQHSDNFGFPFVTTDVMCPIPENCTATHVSLLTKPDRVGVFNQPWLPIRNKKEENKLQFDFTVCVSNLFGDYNNVLQFAQTLEMYRLLGVNRVVIYKTSCGPDLDRLLQSYSQEGFVEIVPWPIDQHLNPSRGWLFSEHGGDVHYFGQLTTLNECVYRSMHRSRYVLLNDIDEIVMPYQHDNLQALMDVLQKQHPDTGVFLIENHIFPKTHFEPSGRFHLRQWNKVAGVNILEHIYREEPARNIYHPYKLIVQPRMVEQTSVHEVLKNSGPWFKVPPDVCRLIHVRVALRGSLKLEELNVDKRLWTFSAKLIPNVDKQLKKVGLLTSEGGELTDGGDKRSDGQVEQV